VKLREGQSARTSRCQIRRSCRNRTYPKPVRTLKARKKRGNIVLAMLFSETSIGGVRQWTLYLSRGVPRFIYSFNDEL